MSLETHLKIFEYNNWIEIYENICVSFNSRYENYLMKFSIL